jgi:hypothetical protein
MIVGKVGKGKRVPFIGPFILINRQLGCLPRCKGKTIGLFNNKLFYVVGNVMYIQYSNNMFHDEAIIIGT